MIASLSVDLATATAVPGAGKEPRSSAFRQVHDDLARLRGRNLFARRWRRPAQGAAQPRDEGDGAASTDLLRLPGVPCRHEPPEQSPTCPPHIAGSSTEADEDDDDDSTNEMVHDSPLTSGHRRFVSQLVAPR